MLTILADALLIASGHRPERKAHERDADRADSEQRKWDHIARARG
jgi:hypothetical protein